MMLIGVVVIFTFPLWGSRDVFFYRCPRCRRKATKVRPEGLAEPNLHHACEGCRVIRDLGWAWHGGGEGGG